MILGQMAKNLRPTTPKEISPRLSLCWDRFGAPIYRMTPTQYLGLHPDSFVSQELNDRWKLISRRRKRLVKRWLKDYRVYAPVPTVHEIYSKEELPGWLPDNSTIRQLIPGKVRIVLEDGFSQELR